MVRKPLSPSAKNRARSLTSYSDPAAEGTVMLICRRCKIPVDFDRLIAIMLGRLEMTVEECIEKFCAYADTIFDRSKRRIRLLGHFSAPKYDANHITQATRRLVGHFDPTPEDEKWKRNVFESRYGRCKT